MINPKFLAICLTLLLPNAGYSADNYQLGNEMYNQKKYAEALKHYLLVTKEKPIDFKLAYNLGVTLYRLQRFEESEQYLQLSIKQNPGFENAYLNLAITQIKLNKTAESRQHLTFLIDNGRSESVKNAATTLRSRIENKNSPNIPFTLFAWTGAEDQIEDISGEPVSHESNLFFEFMALYTQQFNNDYKNGYGIIANIFGILYQHNQEYNLYFFNFGFDKRFTLNNFLFKPGVDISQSYFGSDAYQRSMSADLNIEYKANKNVKLKTRLTAANIYALSNQYNYLNGQQEKIRFEAQLKTLYAQKITPGLELELNQREDIETTTLTSSQSPVRIKFNVSYRIKYWNPWVYKAKTEYRYSRYPGNYISTSYNERRIEKRASLALGLEKPVSKHLNLLLDYSYSTNQSSIDVFTFQKNQITLGVEYEN